MTPFPLNLAVFDSSKGHFGRTDIYKRTIDELAAQFPLSLFKNLVVHIKTQDGEETVLKEQRAFYETRGFTVLVSDQAWSHHDVSHQHGYSADLIKVYGLSQLGTAEFTLHLESDWLFAPHNGDVEACFARSIQYLRANPTALAVRFPRFHNEVDRLNNLRAKHGLDVDTAQDLQWPQFYRHNDNLSLNPSIFRTRDLYATTRILNQHFEQLGSHVEMGYTKAWDHLRDGDLPFAIYDPSHITVRHIGCKVGDEDPAEGVSEVITS